ncbi:hypothetical protein BDV95DRAFT_607990 [Massariosphaeria phaeospora]|uniref:Rhodopsin domain-containing protein n=1 Tax=Massariosphaeria phaeospora TaxID=100035 RepID=A0A7C8M998_9PLEO|nr:hypothetical protein BDV95DRAFT_607990 [Massariosphaeria phaeospora]
MPRTPTPQEMAAWPAPNYVDPETRRPLVLGINIPLLVLMIAFISMRFYSRTVIVRALGKDDWFMLAAAVTAVATSIMTCIATQPEYQTGYHLWDLRPEIAKDPVKTAQMAMATQLLFVPITALTKISILLTYLRIFPSRLNRLFCYWMMGFTTVWAFGAFFMALFQCSPVQSYWYIAEYPNRKCINVGPLYYITGGLNVISDGLIFLWPAKDLVQIHISLKQRVTLVAMFTLGVLICVAGACRMWYTSVYLASYDALWHGCTIYAIVTIETSIGIICGCLPACKPLLTKMVPQMFPTTQSSTHRSAQKKASKLDGRPFESLGEGIIVKEEGYSVVYDDAKSQYKERTVTNVSTSRGRDDDNVSAESEQWIMMDELKKPSKGQRVRLAV